MNGILFKPDMIQAIIEGRKTQTRRLGGLKEINKTPDIWECLNPTATHLVTFYNEGTAFCTRVKPPYQAGETVYIKEAWRTRVAFDGFRPSQIPDDAFILFKGEESSLVNGRWRSPLHLRGVHARYFLEITDVRAERLQEITEEDAKAEGVEYTEWFIPNLGLDGKDNLRAFYYLWNSINKEKWESNPWVWVYTFRNKEGK